jgi:uncharacterized protein (DUF697 family)
MDNVDIGSLVKKAIEEATRERGHANVLIAGRSGVGKSTLINAVFQGNLATTGQGRPVTDEMREVTKPGVPLTVFDTRGLEMAAFSETLQQLKSFIVARARDQDPRKHIHVAWLCIAEDLRRVEEAETALVNTLGDFLPVLAIVTKARADQGFRVEVQRLLPQARNVVRVRAIPEQLDDGHSLPPMGLAELVQATVDLVPEGQRRAFVASQKADLSLKKSRSRKIVASAATAAMGIAATPIPFADAFLLVPTQVAMLAGISATYGLDVDAAFISTLVGATIGGGAAMFSGRAIVTGILKLIPGGGQLVGGAIAAATAGSLTTALGEAYVNVLHGLFVGREGEQPSEAEVLASLRQSFAK